MSILLAVLEEVVREAGSIAMAYFKDLKNVEVNKKSPRDFVTAADVAVEEFLKEACSLAGLIELIRPLSGTGFKPSSNRLQMFGTICKPCAMDAIANVTDGVNTPSG